MTVRDRDSLVKTYSIPCVIIVKVFIDIVVSFSTQSFNQSKILQYSIYVYKIIPIKYLRYQTRNSLKPLAVSKQKTFVLDNPEQKRIVAISNITETSSLPDRIFSAQFTQQKKKRRTNRGQTMKSNEIQIRHVENRKREFEREVVSVFRSGPLIK